MLSSRVGAVRNSRSVHVEGLSDSDSLRDAIRVSMVGYGQPMDEKLCGLLQEFSRALAATNPPDLDTLGLAYMQRAFELGKGAGRAEVRADRTDPVYQPHTDGSGGDGGPEL